MTRGSNEILRSKQWTMNNEQWTMRSKQWPMRPKHVWKEINDRYHEWDPYEERSMIQRNVSRYEPLTNTLKLPMGSKTCEKKSTIVTGNGIQTRKIDGPATCENICMYECMYLAVVNLTRQNRRLRSKC
jgi:hypothetical protein